MSVSFLKTYWSAIAKFFGLWVPCCCSVDDCSWIAKHSLRIDLPDKVWKDQIWCRNIRLTFGHLCSWDSHCFEQIPERNDLREKDWFYLHDFSLSQCGGLSGAQGFSLCCPGSRECACCIGYFSLPPFLFNPDPHPWNSVAYFQRKSFFLRLSSLETPSQIHPKVHFSILGASLFSHMIDHS